MTPTPFVSVLLLAAALPLTPSQPVDWVYSLADATERAAASDRPILVYCWADGSDYCGKLWQETLSKDEAADAMREFVCYSAKHGGDGVQEVFEKYGVRTLPTILFLTPDGQADDLIQGFIPVADFDTELARIRKGEGTVRGLQRQIEQHEDGSKEDIDARWALAGKIQALGNNDRHDELMDSIRKIDDKGKTVVGARVRMQDVIAKIVGDGDGKDGKDGKDGQDGGDGMEETDAQRAERIRKWDLEPLYAHVRLVKPAEAKHEAWVQIGNMELKREDDQAAFAAFHSAWKTCPDDKVVDWSNGVARWIVENGDERTSKEKKFALQLAESALATMRKKIADNKSEGGEGAEKLAKYEAYCWNTVAWCQHANGQTKKAVKAAKKAVALHENDHFVADLERFMKQ